MGIVVTHGSIGPTVTFASNSKCDGVPDAVAELGATVLGPQAVRRTTNSSQPPRVFRRRAQMGNMKGQRRGFPEPPPRCSRIKGKPTVQERPSHVGPWFTRRPLGRRFLTSVCASKGPSAGPLLLILHSGTNDRRTERLKNAPIRICGTNSPSTLVNRPRF